MGFISKRWVWAIGEESSFKVETVQFTTSPRKDHKKVSRERSCVKHMTGNWRIMSACHFANTSWERPSREVLAKLSVWKKDKVFYQIFNPCYKYPYYPRIVRNAFQRENPRKSTWELEIVISTIIYTFCNVPVKTKNKKSDFFFFFF